MKRLCVIMMVVVVLIGCHRKEQEAQARLDTLSSETRTKLLEPLGAVAQKLLALPPLSEDTLKYSGPPLEAASTTDRGNTAVVGAIEIYELSHTAYPKSQPDMPTFPTPWSSAMELMNKGKPFEGMDASGVEVMFEGVRNLAYVLAVKGMECTRPVLKGQSYVVGTFSGEAHLFSLQSAQHFGGFRFNARSSPEVLVTSDRHANANVQEADAKRMMQADFESQIHAALTAGLHARVKEAVIKEGLSW